MPMASKPEVSPDPWIMQAEFTSNRLNLLAEALGARSYLEIGVETGITFERVRVAERTGVDPAFLFDITEHANETTAFAQTTSDEFFLRTPRGETIRSGLHRWPAHFRAGHDRLSAGRS